jgi:hypothetical protein
MTLAQELERVIEVELPHLRAIPEAEAGAVAASGATSGWSRKEEMGHLIDSASNNHLRFVRAALEPEFHGPSYDQNGSVILHGYQQSSWSDLLEFWRRYNLLLAQVIARIPVEKLETRCQVGDGARVSLEFLIRDYVAHMQHHLDHILGRPTTAW